MAESLAHRFGQIIGELMEIALKPNLQAFADKHGLYLDVKGERPARKGKKLTWTDINGNSHDLDFVLERNGTANQIGIPVAFIESAWRRYTKHSKNKAQEIQGAILPLKEKHKDYSPFIGAILAGEFTSPAIRQLESSGFAVLYFPYHLIVDTFAKFGIDASSTELTTESEFKKKIAAWDRLAEKETLGKTLLDSNYQNVQDFFNRLAPAVLRKIDNIIIWPLHGHSSTLNSIQDAITFIDKYSESLEQLPFVKYEIIIHYNTGTRIDALCMNKSEAIEILQKYL